ncbi:MAG: flagellar hook-basal body complex protein, partial [Lachnospiraceae bacterium]|nr:flagellar hook-basal body complex protein [Lachnospiraceae bacterium]
MMRSLFSGVSGLKTHQTRMDVIGNNIANVNTTAYKSMNMVFSDLLYQQTQAASGANADTGRGGVNARQIGLGAKTAAINTAITRQGSAQSTNNPWDVMISGESFFIVSSGNGGQNFFTRDGSFTIDGAGNLVMASTGYKVMGWQVDPDTGEIQSDVVSALQVMNRDNLIADPEYTTNGYASGIVDKLDTQVHSKAGKIMTLTFYDAEGYSYTAKMSIHAMSKDGEYYVQLDDITNSDGVSLKTYYNVSDITQIANFGAGGTIDPETKVYTTAQGVTYNLAADGTQTFRVDYSFDEALTGFSSNPLMQIGGNSVKVKDGTVNDGDAMPATVTMTGSVTLTKDVLQNDYKLTYDEKDKAYYYLPDGATTPVKLESEPADATAAAPWETVLAKLGGTVKISTDAATNKPQLKVNEDGTVDVTFEADFAQEPDMAGAVYNAATGKFAKTLAYPGADDAATQEVMEKAYGLHNDDMTTYTINYITPDGHASITKNESYNGNMLVFNTQNGKFSYIGNQEQNAASITFSASATDMTGQTIDLGHFHDISIDFSSLTNINNGKVSTAGLDNGDGSTNNLGSGRKHGELIGIE